MMLRVSFALLVTACSFEASLGSRSNSTSSDAGVDAWGLMVDAAEGGNWETSSAVRLIEEPFDSTGPLVASATDLYWIVDGTVVRMPAGGGEIVETITSERARDTRLVGDAGGFAFVTDQGHVIVQAWTGAATTLATPGVDYRAVALAGDQVIAVSANRLDRFPRAGGTAETLIAAPRAECPLRTTSVIVDAGHAYYSATKVDVPGCPYAAGGPTHYFAELSLDTGTARVIEFVAQDALAVADGRLFGTQRGPVKMFMPDSMTVSLHGGWFGPEDEVVSAMGVHAAEVFWGVHKEADAMPMSEVACASTTFGSERIRARGPGAIAGMVTVGSSLYFRTRCTAPGCASSTLRRVSACHVP